MMKKTIAILAFALLASAAASAERTGPARSASLDNLRIKGVMMYDNDKSVENIGLYSYTVTSPVARRILLPMPRIYVNGGSVAVGGKLYTYSSMPLSASASGAMGAARFACRRISSTKRFLAMEQSHVTAFASPRNEALVVNAL